MTRDIEKIIKQFNKKFDVYTFEDPLIRDEIINWWLEKVESARLEGRNSAVKGLVDVLYNDLWNIEEERSLNGKSFIMPDDLKRITETILEGWGHQS